MLKVNSVKKKFSGNGDRRGSENVAVRIESVNVKDTKSANPKEDYFLATLMHDAFGMVAEFDDKGQPLTELKVMVKDREIKGEHRPYEVVDFRKGSKKGNSPRMGDHPVAILEGAYFDQKAGAVICGWLHCAMHEAPADPLDPEAYASATEMVLPDVMVKVEKEKNKKSGDGSYQRRSVYMTHMANRFGSKEEFENAAAQFLQDNDAAGGGYPFIVVRLYNENDPLGENLVATINRRRDEETGAVETPEEAVKNWLAAQAARDESEDKDENWAHFIENSNDGSYVFEVIPGYTYMTGGKSLPSQRKGMRDDQNFEAPILGEDGNIARDRDGVPYTGQFIMRGHMMIKRIDDADGLGRWFATGSMNVERGKALPFAMGELITNNTEPAAIEKFTAAAQARLDAAISLRSKDTPAPRGDEGPDYEDGAPDPSSGFSPN